MNAGSRDFISGREPSVVARRPEIRPRPVTPPRIQRWFVPAPAAPPRKVPSVGPVLALVPEDDVLTVAEIPLARRGSLVPAAAFFRAHAHVKRSAFEWLWTRRHVALIVVSVVMGVATFALLSAIDPAGLPR
jgi:hypothetical protein